MNKTYLHTISLSELRIFRGMTQKEVAKIIKVKQPYISALESGKSRPNIDTLQKLCEIYNCEICFYML